MNNSFVWTNVTQSLIETNLDLICPKEEKLIDIIDESISKKAPEGTKETGNSLSQAIDILEESDSQSISDEEDEKSRVLRIFKGNNIDRQIGSLGKYQWLNDNVVNFVLRSLSLCKGKRKDIIVLDSLLVNQLKACYVEKENKEKIMRIIQEKVKEVDLDTLKGLNILLPMNKGNSHWIIVEIKLFTNIITIFDSYHSPLVSEEKFYVIAVLNGARALFLQSKVNNQKFNLFKNSRFIIMVNKNIPFQKNGYDCGLYCVLYATYLYFGVEDKMVFGSLFVSYFRYFLYCHFKHKPNDLITFEEDIWQHVTNETEATNIDYGKYHV